MYLFNNLNHTLLFKNGHIEVKAQTVYPEPIMKSDIDAGIFENALAKKMITFYNSLAEIPESMGLPTMKIKLETAQSGLGEASMDDLKAFVAKNKSADAKATTTPIGKQEDQGEGANVPSDPLPPVPGKEPPSEPLPPVPTEEPGTEQAPAPGKSPKGTKAKA